MSKCLNKKGEINTMKINKKNIESTQNKKKINGITLIALVVTVVILLILASVSINGIFGQNGIIKQAEEAKRKTLILQKEQEVSLAISSLFTKYWGDKSEITVSEVIEMVQENYATEEEKSAITGVSEEDDKFPGTIEYDEPASGLKGKIIVTVDENFNVTASIIESSENEDSTYLKVGNIYCNEPDLSGFNKESTYYVTYDNVGTETIYGRLDKEDPPETWYDYEKQKWANIVTVTDDNIAYWVWIPRYKYKITEDGTLDVKFVSVRDKCVEVSEDGSEKNLNLAGYSLPESFKFGGKQLSGYWISKYEVQDSANNEEKLKLIGETLTTTAENVAGNTYTIYVNGEAKTGQKLPTTLSSLGIDVANKDICVVNETTKMIVGAIKDINDITDESAIQVDTSNFNKKATYYITYDDITGEEKIAGRMDKISAPGNWYNYRAKKWANIVTVTGNNVTYWTYIPRYEYKAFSGAEYADIKFISKDQTEPDKNYQIPESFTFNNVPLAGYWISKYEVQESDENNTEKLQLTGEGEEATLTTTAENVAGNTYTIYVNGEAKTGQSLPAKLSDLGVDANNKDICVVNETSKMIVGAIRDSEE